MKKIIFILLIIVSVPALRAQETSILTQQFSKHEFGVSWGGFPTAGVWNGIAFWMPGDEVLGNRNPSLSNIYPLFEHSAFKVWEGSDGQHEYYKMQHYGCLTLNYQYHFSKKHSIGVGTSWLGRYILLYSSRLATNEIIDTKSWENLFSVYANYRFTYFCRKNISLYTALHLGIAFKFIDKKLLFDGEQSAYFMTAIQITGIGIEVGNPHTFFSELGFGAQGLIKIGYKFKYNNKVN